MGNAYLDKAAQLSSPHAAHAAVLRQEHLKREGQIYTLAYAIVMLGFLLAVCGLVAAASHGIELLNERKVEPAPTADHAIAGTIFLAIGAFGVWVWWGGKRIGHFDPTGKLVARILEILLMLLTLPLGPFVISWICAPLFGRESDPLFSDEYREAIEATPHITPRLTFASKILLGALGLVIVFLLTVWISVILKRW